LSIGQTVDKYRILSHIGTGGMGMVYAAHDSRLERTVALKVLPDELTGDWNALGRFQREFRALSALNHPNICTIYDAGEADGWTFIAMEHVAGTTLDRRIGRKGLALREALSYAVQIAGALATAHAEGIVHRDLKPANIMVSDGSHVKLLDFGVAKLLERARPGNSAVAVKLDQDPPTIEGTIVGTAAYMSPEQAAGRKLDARSDIFSFGAVFYEMITARRCFTGDDDISTLSAVLNTEPAPLTNGSPDIPRELERIMARCLRKDPERRFQNAADLKVALQEILEELASGKPMAVGLQSWRRAPVAIVAVCVVSLIAASLIWLLRRPTQGKSHNLVITRLTADSGLTTSPAISSDSKLVAFASDRGGGDNLDIWVQQVAGGPPNRITSDPADDTLPVFSPDGSKIAFLSARDGGGIYIVSTLGGGERRVVKTGAWTSRPRFSPDGKSIAYSTGMGRAQAGLYIVSATGGAPTALKLSVPWGIDPVWSPDGKRLLFVGSTDPAGFGAFDWWVAPVEGGQAIKTGAYNAFASAGLKPRSGSNFISPANWRSDHILFVARVGDSANLWQSRISSKNWQIHDAPERLTTAAEQERHVSVASDGRLVFDTVDERLNLWMLATDANQGKTIGNPQLLTPSAGNSSRPSLSADGRKLVFQSDRSGNIDIWLRELESGTERPLTATPWDETHPSISADGSKVFYTSREEPRPIIHVVNVETGVTERLCEDCGVPMAWSPDGRRIAFYYGAALTRYASLDVLTRRRSELIGHPKHNLHMVRFFSQGDWLCFHVPLPGSEPTSPIFIAPIREGAASSESSWIQVTDGSGIEATPWSSADASILYFLSKRDGFQCIWAQPLEPMTKRPKGAPFAFAHFHGARRKLQEINFGPGANSNKLVFTMNDSTGNIWITKSESPN
jgi:serine/threonine protein kinase